MAEPARSTVLRDVDESRMRRNVMQEVDLGVREVVPGTSAMGPAHLRGAGALPSLAEDVLSRLDPSTLAEVTDLARAQAAEAGFAQGIAEAELRAAEMEALFSARASAAVEALTTAAQALNAREAEGWSTIGVQLVDAAIAIAQEIIGHELSIDPTPVRTAVRRALAMAPEGRVVLIHLHPDDAMAMTPADSDALRIDAGGRTLEVVPDGRVQPGGCLLEVGATLVDARIETALARVRATLVGDEAGA